MFTIKVGIQWAASYFQFSMEHKTHACTSI